MKKGLQVAFLFIFFAGLLNISNAKEKKVKIVDWQLAKEVIMEAYIYAYPLLISEITRTQTTNFTEPTGLVAQAPENQFSHATKFSDANFTSVVKPNVDTLYSTAWINLEMDPMVISVPNTSGRYYVLQLMDIWTEVFSAPGSRTTGTKEQHTILVGPNYNKNVKKEKLNRENVRIIKSPTNNLALILRMQTNGEEDYGNVHTLQKHTKITPLSKWNTKNFSHQKHEVDIHIDMVTPPVVQVANLNAEEYFGMFAELMKTTNSHINDSPIIARLEQIGFFVGESYTYEKMSYRFRNLLAHTSKEAYEKIVETSKSLASEKNGWQSMIKTVGSYGASDYLQRATIAYTGWGANLPDDAIYPMTSKDYNGKLLTGKNKYKIHFEKDKLPPVNAFWSITLYKENNLLFDNNLGRYAVGDRSNLKFNKDGSLTIYIQHEKPVKSKRSNWLPAPKDGFNLAMRLYWPKPEVKYGSWNPPGVERIKK